MMAILQSILSTFVSAVMPSIQTCPTSAHERVIVNIFMLKPVVDQRQSCPNFRAQH